MRQYRLILLQNFTKFASMKNRFSLYLCAVILALFVWSCEEEKGAQVPAVKEEKTVEADLRYGYDFNQYNVQSHKIKRGDTFGAILEKNGIDYPEVYTILQKIKGSVNVRKLQIGKPYILLFTKDSVPTPKAFIYHPDALGYSVVQLRDSVFGKKVQKPIRTVELQATGVIQSSLYETMQNSGYNSMLTYFLADVYA